MGPESDVRMPLTAHLEELRTRIIRALGATAAGGLVAWLVIERLVAFLLAPLATLRPDQSLIIGTGVTEAFFTKLKVAAIAGVFVASPVILYQVWRFVAPGLHQHEKWYVVPFVIFGTLFFLGGAVFCYELVFQVGYAFFIDQYASIGIEPALR